MGRAIIVICLIFSSLKPAQSAPIHQGQATNDGLHVYFSEYQGFVPSTERHVPPQVAVFKLTEIADDEAEAYIHCDFGPPQFRTEFSRNLHSYFMSSSQKRYPVRFVLPGPLPTVAELKKSDDTFIYTINGNRSEYFTHLFIDNPRERRFRVR